ncbi:hypothetical protein [Nostoc sp.]
MVAITLIAFIGTPDEDIQQALIIASSYFGDRIIELPNRYEIVA